MDKDFPSAASWMRGGTERSIDSNAAGGVAGRGTGAQHGPEVRRSCGRKADERDNKEVCDMLEAGMKAPDFTLPDQDGNQVTLSSFKGKKVILYFYPRDNTPGCTKQACGFAGLYPHFLEKGAVVLGVSKDSVASHKKFQEKYDLSFTLISDTELEAIKAYDVWQEKNMYGKKTMGVVRTTYLIDENGVIEKVFGKVKAADNPQQMLDELK